MKNAKANLTPMMQQYMDIKEQYKDCILFYRLGDFYEMFFDDAITCSKVLEITLTGKNCGQEERAPMCGVPFHSAESYLSKLVSKGYKVAICEQVEDPKEAKGIVKRDVVRIVTPGTNINTQTLDETKNNYLMSIIAIDKLYGIAYVDVTTGEFMLTEVDTDKKLKDEITKIAPSEIICNSALSASGFDMDDLKQRLGIAVSEFESWQYNKDNCISKLKEHFCVNSLEGLGLGEYSIGIMAAGALLISLYETQKNSLEHITTVVPYITSKYMVLDSATRRNLELVETLREKQKRGSLLWVLDKTKTAMGARLMRKYIEQPLIDKETINKRLDAIEEINKSAITREELREYLNPIYDLERLLSKVSYNSVNPRDMIAFKASVAMLPFIKCLLKDFESYTLKDIYENIDSLEDICSLIENAIVDEPPINVKEGGIIKDGYNEEVDKLRSAKSDGKSWLADIELKEKEKTGIKNLRIKYNKVFGYYLEVTNSYKNLVPDTWTRKQTLTNAERYITPELKELEDIILGAEDRLFSLEYNLFNELRDIISKEILRIQTTAKAIARLDVFCSLAVVAEHNNFVRPTINTDGVIDIRDGRHPVVEKMISNDMFVANDTYLNDNSSRVSIITGPNMAGKSTYMRQTALIVLMAQIGSFVPATKADIGIVDRIFTRVGASDDLASGQSTFMVEMTEVANILRNATKDSLLILDEIGRGTSTFDGLGIAWAVIEHISNEKLLGAKTLFATHYHELTELEGKLESVNNYCIDVKEKGDNIVFLRKIIKGGADKSYGIQVAKLAGVPDNVLKRARVIVDKLSNNDIALKVRDMDIFVDGENNADNAQSYKNNNNVDTSLYNDGQFNNETSTDSTTKIVKSLCNDGKSNNVTMESKSEYNVESKDEFYCNENVISVIDNIKNLNLSKITPLEAINMLYEYQEKVVAVATKK